MNIKKSRSYVTRYIVYTYGLFLLLFFTLGGIATQLLHGTPQVMDWLIVITAWTPTYTLLIMFKKIYPNSSLKAFFKEAFKERLNLRLLTTITIVQIIIYILCVCTISFYRGIAFKSISDFSLSNLVSAFFFTLIQGATGEESGWRGYLLPEIEKTTGIAKGSLIVGFIWSLWHSPIWFFGTGYKGEELVIYIVSFIICITSLGFVIGICYHRCKNLIVPIWIHFIFNFLGETYAGSMLDLVICYALFYFLAAVGFFIWYKRHRFIRYISPFQVDQ